MGLKSIITSITIFLMSSIMLSAGGCRRGGAPGQTSVDTRSANVAPSDFKPDDKSGAKGAEKAGGETASADSNQAETNSIVDKGGEGIDLAEREEIRRSYTLQPGAEVTVSNINGRVDVETAEIDHAEVLVVRSAKKREDLQFRKIRIEHDPTELSIRVENDRRSVWSAFGSIPEGHQRVILKLPRKVRLETNGVNGDVAIGEIDGSVDVHGLNGKVNIAQATGAASFRGVNGRVDATIAGFSTGGGADVKSAEPQTGAGPEVKGVRRSKGGGIDINGVNGNITLRFVGEINADVEAWGHNGRVESDLPNLQEDRNEKRYGHYSARIGTGGPRIRIGGVNGNVFLTKAEKQTAKATAK